jgi:hypothetical protein
VSRFVAIGGVATCLFALTACPSQPIGPDPLDDAGPAHLGSGDGGRDAGPDAGLDAGIDGGPDLTPPSFEVFITAPDRGNDPCIDWRDPYLAEWKLDEDPIVGVRWDAGDVDVATVFLEVGDGDGGWRRLDGGQMPADQCGCQGQCLCWALDGTALPFQRLDPANYDVRSGGSDLSGNASPLATATGWRANVLWKWTCGKANQTSPALDPDGNLYVSLEDGLVSLTPNAATRWRWMGNTHLQAVYLAENDGGGLVAYADDTYGLTVIAASDAAPMFNCPIGLNGPFTAGPVLVETQGRRVIAALGTDTLSAMSWDRLTPSGLTCDTLPAPFQVDAGQSPVVIDTRVCFAGDDVKVHCAQVLDAGVWDVAGFTDAVLGGDRIGSLAVAPLNGTLQVIGVTDGMDGGLFVLSPSASALSLFYSTPSHEPVFLNTVTVRRATDDSVTAMVSTGLPAYFVNLNLASVEPLDAMSPNWGGAALIAAADRSVLIWSYGYLESYLGDPPTVTHEAASGNVLSNDVSPGALDCGRRTHRYGVMYGVSNDRVLGAQWVPSRGIDVNAPWPKFQRDPANTGNATVDSLSAYVCP